MPGLKGVSAPAVAAAGAGGLFIWSGLKGAKISTAARQLLQGQQPSPGGNPIAGTGTLTGPQNAGAAPLPNSPGTYSNSQLRSLWIMAGGSPSKAAVAACIAQHESSGNATVTSSNPDGGTNVGLWQLDTPGGKGAGYTVAQLQNAITNARVAVRGSSNGNDWSAWATAPMCGV